MDLLRGGWGPGLSGGAGQRARQDRAEPRAGQELPAPLVPSGLGDPAGVGATPVPSAQEVHEERRPPTPTLVSAHSSAGPPALTPHPQLLPSPAGPFSLLRPSPPEWTGNPGPSGLSGTSVFLVASASAPLGPRSAARGGKGSGARVEERKERPLRPVGTQWDVSLGAQSARHRRPCVSSQPPATLVPTTLSGETAPRARRDPSGPLSPVTPQTARGGRCPRGWIESRCGEKG